MAFGAMAAALGGAAISGLSGAQATRDANRANVKMARENMKWQEKMSNTAHQRESADLKAAGLNPIIGLGGGGASTGSAQMIEQKAANDLQGPQEGISNAMETRRLKKEIEAVESTAKLNLKQGDLIDAQDLKMNTDRQLTNTQNRALMRQMPAIEAETQARLAEADLAKKQASEEAKHVKFDSVQKRTQRVIDGVSSAVDIINPLKGLKNAGHSARSSKSYTDETYSRQGEHLGSKTRRYHD